MRRWQNRNSEHAQQVEGRDAAGGGRLFLRVAGAAAPEFSPLFRRAGNFADRDLDDAAGDQLAGLPADRIGAAAGPGWDSPDRYRRSYLLPLPGVWVDRLNRQRVLVVTQGLAMLQSLALAALTLAKVITIHEIIALSAFQGVINAFDMPARQSFMVQMVEDRQDDWETPSRINSSMVNMAQLVGPSLAGIVIAGVGEGYCFLIDGISYMAVIASLLLMRLPAVAIKGEAASMLKQLKEGWTYVSGFAPVRSILLSSSRSSG